MPDWLLTLITNYGYGIVFLVVFLNNAGFPLPGDTVLLGTGLMVQSGLLSLGWIWGFGTAASFLGGVLSYWVGRRVGRKILYRIPFLRITPEKANQFERFLKKHGAKAVFFARFLAILHPVTGLVAGIGKIRLKPFLIYNLAGSAAYVLTYTLLGYFFGSSWDILRVWMGRAAAFAFLILAALALVNFLLHNEALSLFNRISKKK